jgi:hypothetical protein
MAIKENGLGFATNEFQGLVVTEPLPTTFILTEADLAALEYPLDHLHEAELKGFSKAWDYLSPLLEQALHDAERFFRALGRATNLEPLSKPSRSYAEVCRARGDLALAERVERDLAKLQFEVTK